MKATKKIVNVRLEADQITAIQKRIKGSTLLDTSKFVRLAVDWLLLADLGEVLRELEGNR